MAELVLALDLDDQPRALDLLARLSGVRWVKVGSVLFTGAGPGLVERLRGDGYQVFLDLKWHDIPSTVRGAVKAAGRLGVHMVTVHALGGAAMLSAAKDAAGDGLAVVAVTLLTSHSGDDFGPLTGRAPVDAAREARRLASLAVAAGVDGVVCSAAEVGTVREAVGPGKLLVTPGIRSGAAPRGDQSRVATAGAAARAGATHLVVGRPVLEARDPAAAWARLLTEVEG